MEQEVYRHVPYDVEVEQALLSTAILVDNSRRSSASPAIGQGGSCFMIRFTNAFMRR